MPMTAMGVAGTPKLKFYEMDFGWGKPRKHETISINYSDFISLSACKESNEDMETFVPIFEKGLEAYV
ncbi:Chloramphenicol acetyltransferase-like domain-containing protein [Cynara cardunculus var. scolymus]|uniref:Chloramphenicol acetyltransferase-like domain-containing protein n=1 Tax=Cynara cardunculus var. scolymus TaxID=59895 RepID=A0A103Y801_CYNCS|nr:Chloramphenicol acetyltransferase-like domain-containing protein [Cynara cardunculus var. scolymus]